MAVSLVGCQLERAFRPPPPQTQHAKQHHYMNYTTISRPQLSPSFTASRISMNAYAARVVKNVQGCLQGMMGYLVKFIHVSRSLGTRFLPPCI